MLKYHLLLIFFFVSVRLYAQLNPPDLRCLEVLPNGDVKLTWLPPANPGSQFSSYEIYSSTTLNGTYTPIGTGLTSITTKTFTHVGAKANLNSLYYFVLAKYNGGINSSSPSVILRSIRLNILSFIGAQNLTLSYNHLHEPKLNSSSGNYSINKEYPINTWSVFAQTPLVEYPDTLSICATSINYQISLPDNSGCVSKSNLVGGLYGDTKQPNEPFIDSVSVLEDGRTIVAWRIPFDKDIIKYYVNHYNATDNIVLFDSIAGRQNTSYIYTLTTANTKTVGVFIGAKDPCGPPGTFGNYAMTSIFLKTTYNRCAYSTELTWNDYKKMPEGLYQYKIYCSVNNGNYKVVGTTTLTSFTHTNASPDATLSYFVRAVNVGQTISASSNRVRFYSSQVKAPGFAYIISAGVRNKKFNVLNFAIDTATNYSAIDVLRSDNGTDYSFIGSVAFGNTYKYSYTDDSSLPSNKSYYYKLIIKDSCGNSRTESNVCKTIFLTVTDDNEQMFIRHLKWSGYEGFNGGIKNYTIYRIINDVVESVPAGSTYSDTPEFTDQIEDNASKGSNIEYVVSAIEGNENVHGFVGESFSNFVSVYTEGLLFVPNAFAPNGINTTWKPITHFVDTQDYNLRVYDRWGRPIFTTANSSEAWDGGDYPGGIYFYVITYKNSRGEYKEKKGSVNLIR